MLPKAPALTESYLRSLEPAGAAVFLEFLTISTQQGRILWVRKDDAISGSLPGGFTLQFATRRSTFDGQVLWEVFAVFNEHGREVFGVNRWEIAAGAFYLDELFLTATDASGNRRLPVC